MKHLLLITIAAVLLVVAEEGNAYALDFVKTEFKAPSGNVLRYAIMKPEKVKTEETYPLVISLHGSGGRGNNNWERNCHANVALGKSERRKQYPCYVIAPTVKKSQRWNGETLKTLFELISSLQTKHAIDPDRIYVTGQSMGGYGTFAAITLRPKLFAAAAPVCGGGQTELAKQIAQIPIWVFHGAKDPTVPVERSREMVEALKKAGGTPTYTEYPDVRHNAWTRAYEDNKFWKWLFSQYRKHGGKTAKELQPPSQLLPIPDNLVVLTFDDGNKSDFANVPKVLKKHGFGATFYVTEGLGFLKNPQNYLSWEQIRQLHEMGYEIGNHTQHHRNVSHLKSEELAASLAHIDKRCAENKITKPVTFCYPGFHNNHASVKVLEKHGFLFARRGVGPEYKDPGKGARGPAYDPKVDDPLLVPTTGYAGPDWKMKDLKWAIDQAEDGKITVLCFHGIPAIEHPWVSTDLKDFEKYMQYLKDEGCTVIAMRDLAKYVNPNHRPHKADPYQPVRKRVAEMKRKAAKKE